MLDFAFVNIKNTPNTGDQVCTPYLYFDFPNAEHFHIDDKIPDCKVAVYGGGAIEPYLRVHRIHDFVNAKKKVSWAIGTSRSGTKDHGELVNDLDICSVRELNREGGDYVPCVSCMSSLFDQKFEVDQEVVFYKHAKKTKEGTLEGLPQMSNRAPFDEVIEFLGRSQTVVTNSFHGVYWATLLGKKVVCIPFSSKFYGFKYPPAYAKWSTWEKQVQKAVSHNEALEDCRKLNVSFYERVISLYNAVE